MIERKQARGSEKKVWQRRLERRYGNETNKGKLKRK
jgi:hypothetical protein